MQPLFNQGLQLVANIRRYSSVKSIIIRTGESIQTVVMEPESRKELEFPSGHIDMKDGTSFLMSDKGGDYIILKFCPTKGKTILSTRDSFIIDGTL